jgi:hypothetical protein
MKIMMSETKPAETLEVPTYIVSGEHTSESKPARKGPQTKYIAMAVAAVLIVGLVILGIILGVYFFTQAQKEIVKFSFQFKGSHNNDINQDVESDANDNVVAYHVTQEGYDAWIVNDFNKGIQVIKIAVEDAGTNCFVTPLNVSEAMDPSKIKDASSMTGKGGKKGSPSLPYQIEHTPVADRSFLTKKAVDLCSGVSLYWANKKCMDSDNMVSNNDTSAIKHKRSIYYMGTKYGMGGLGGCCYAYWACYVQMTEYYDGVYYTCNTYYQTTWCCYQNAYYNPPIVYPQCATLYYAHWYTPGMVC